MLLAGQELVVFMRIQVQWTKVSGFWVALSRPEPFGTGPHDV